MATNFPTSLDTLTNPTSSDSLSSPSHSAQHANVNDAVEALQAKVGADSSAVTSSLDYKVAQLEAMGEWTTYSPSCSWSGSGSFSFVKYVQVQDLLVLKFKFGLTGAPTGDFAFDAPFPDTDGFAGSMGTATLFDSNGTDYYGTFFTLTDDIKITVLNAGTVDATTPFTWANGDEIRGILTVEKS